MNFLPINKYSESDKMQKYTISTGTITYALRGRDILRQNGYKAAVERNTTPGKQIGCGYTIVTEGDIDKITGILKSKNVKILKIEERSN